MAQVVFGANQTNRLLLDGSKKYELELKAKKRSAQIVLFFKKSSIIRSIL